MQSIAEIDELIGTHRRLYLAALWAGHDGEAECHEMEVDRLLCDRWATMQDAAKGWAAT